MILSQVISHETAACIRQTVGFLLDPFCIICLLFMVVLVYVVLRKQSRWMSIGAICLLLGLLGVSTGWLPHWAITRLENQYTLVKQVNTDVHWVVVLGGGVYETRDSPVNEVLSGVSIKRLLEGVRLYRQLPQAKLIVSGGGAYHPDESVGARMGELAGWFAIPDENRLLETESINTADEAVAVKQWVGDAPFYLVTSANHMPRSMALFQKKGMHPIAAPCGFTQYWYKRDKEPDYLSYLPSVGNVVYLSTAWHEMLGLVWGKIRKIV